MKNLIRMFPWYKEDIKKYYKSMLSWMLIDIAEYSNSTELAEAAASAYNIYENEIDYEIPEWIFDLASYAEELHNNEKGN